jgi:cation diffusion facilitator CzcD-associated flavoprotein CzcO
MREERAIVLGAGFAGLGTAAMLQRRGVPALVLERSDQVAASWRNRYPSLRLNTLRWMSSLKGYRMPRRYGRWPTRDQVIEYLEDYAREERLRIEFETEAKRVTRSNGGWTVETDAGELEAPAVVIAVGYDHDPLIPGWPGKGQFAGELLHASIYRDPEPFRDRDVLVVAPGNTGSEVACELARNGARRVRAAMRSTPNVFRREWLGMPTPLIAAPTDYLPTRIADRITSVAQRVMIGDLSKVGFGPPTYGLATNVLERKVAPVVDAGFVDALKVGEVELVAAVEAFEDADVILADGTRIQPEVVIAATGYERGLDPLVGHLGVLGSDGEPTHVGAPASPAAPGVYFVGYGLWLRGQLPYTSRDTRRVARAIARELSPAGRRGRGPAVAAPRRRSIITR